LWKGSEEWVSRFSPVPSGLMVTICQADPGSRPLKAKAILPFFPGKAACAFSPETARSRATEHATNTAAPISAGK
jgi:hypothetical protein